MHILRVNEKYYNMLKSGKKSIELRLFDEKRQTIKPGDIIEFLNASRTDDKFRARVLNLHQADDFEALCDDIDCQSAGFATNKELIKVMEEFYPLDRQKKFSVVGIEIERV